MKRYVTCGQNAYRLSDQKARIVTDRDSISAYLEVKVKPDQREFKITRTDGNIVVCLKSSPVKNQANMELIKMFTKILKKPVSISSGKNSKVKVLKIEYMTKDEILDALTAIKD